MWHVYSQTRSRVYMYVHTASHAAFGVSPVRTAGGGEGHDHHVFGLIHSAEREALWNSVMGPARQAFWQ